MVKKVLALCLLLLAPAFAQRIASNGATPPPGTVVARGSTGAWLFGNSDALGNLFINGAGGVTPTVASNGNPPAGAMVGLSPSGVWLYLNTDANGNLYTNNSCVGCGGSSGSGAGSGLAIEGRNYNLGKDGEGTAGTDIAEGGRMCFVAEHGFTSMRLLMRSTGNYLGTGAEGQAPNAIIWRAALEYPVSTISTQFTAGGLSSFIVQPAANLLTDSLGASVPAGAPYCIRTYERVPTPPTSPAAATSTVVGQLAASTTYYYKVTAVDDGLESGPTAEFSVGTGAGTSLALSWTIAANASPSAYNVYRSTATGTETQIATISAPAVAFTDTGYGDVTSAKTPPAAPNLIYERYVSAGNSVTASFSSPGTIADITAATGALSVTGPSTTSQIGTFLVVTNDSQSHPVTALGDSITAGSGILIQNNLGSGDNKLANWFDLGFATGTANTSNIGLPSATALAYCNQSSNPTFRASTFQYFSGGYLLDMLGRNDLTNGEIWQQLANCTLQIANQGQAAGAKVYAGTVLPTTASTNNFTTVAQQTITSSTNQTARTNYNNWLLNGAQTTTGSLTGSIATTTLTVTGSPTITLGVGVCLSGLNIAPVTCITALGTGSGGAGTYTIGPSQTIASQAMTGTAYCNTASCGTASPYLAGYFDLAAAIGEVNSSGVVTENGGYWPVPASPLFSGLVLSGTPTATAFTVTTTPFTQFALSGMSIVMTSGSCSGATATITDATGTASLTLYSNGTASPTGVGTFVGLTCTPVAGDTFSVYATSTVDGTHPSFTQNAVAGAAFAIWVSANLKP